ncbi:MAG: DUF885 domain-containing protein [Saprospiraceae bacterium]|nr:DUF885 domain-containing protein [Saprospiraceae bacterium]
MKTSTIFYLFLIGVLISCQQKETKNLETLISNYEEIGKAFKSESPWPEFKVDQLKAKQSKLSAYLKDLEELSDVGLLESDRINKDMLTLIVQNQIELMKFGSHEFPLNAEGGFLTGIIYSINGARINSKKDADKYIEKLKALPAYIDSRIGHLKSGSERGVVSPKLIVDLCLGMVDEVIEGETENTFFLTPVKGKEIQKEVTELVENEIKPAYEKLASYMRDTYRTKANDKIGVREITGGKDFYEHRVRYFATDSITPQEVFDIGMAEVNRIKKEMEQIIQEVNFEGSFEEFQEFLRTDPQFYAKSPQEILNKAAWITKQMEGELPKYFGKLPRMPLTVKPVPAAIAPNYTSGRYSEGSYKNKKAGQYWVNTTKLESRPLYALPALSLHEGVPGHHTQIMLASELEMPDFRRNTYLSAFGEGWALYCEYLGKEAGIYTTPYEDFGRLVYEMWRACRLVVDPGMHYLDWSREEAFEFMKSNTALSIHEINTEINRYIGWPAQAISYKLGELKIKELRLYAETQLGEQFEITEFHDAILSNGSVPLNTLERIIRKWVAGKKS